MNDFTEALVSRCPITIRRRVLWGDCDPAGVIYTPRFSDYAASARDWLLREGVGILDRPHPSKPGIVYPMRAMSFEFHSFLAADDFFDMVADVSGISRRTFTVTIAGQHVGKDELAFSAQLTSVCFDQALGRSVPFPEADRAALECFRRLRSEV